MGDILDEASSLVECKECPWYKACAMPMRFGTDDLMREMHQLAPGSNFGQAGEQEFRNLMMNMASMAQNVLLEGCPVFVRRLKSSPKVAEQLKKLMQSWGSE
ncbi:MAG: hypothetical protein NTU41_13720 [Chloroflexi bacterium]|nr:hypothetical protein [Chloroflexota bacterium]